VEETKILTTVRKVHGTNRPWYEKSGIHGNGETATAERQRNGGNQASRSRIFDLTSHFQDGGHDVISRYSVMPFGQVTRSVCPAHMQQRPPVVLSYTRYIYTPVDSVLTLGGGCVFCSRKLTSDSTQH